MQRPPGVPQLQLRPEMSISNDLAAALAERTLSQVETRPLIVLRSPYDIHPR